MAEDILNTTPESLLPPETGTEPKPIAISEQDNFGRTPTSVEVKKDLEANAPIDNVPLVPNWAEKTWDSTTRSFSSGGNAAYSLYKRLEREALAPIDPNFDSMQYIERNRGLIPKNYEMQFRLADSEIEADAIMHDMTKSMEDQEVLARRGGFGTFVAQGIAGIVDVDTPLAFFSGGATVGMKGGLLATRWGRLASGAAMGGATNMGIEMLAQESGTTPDWTSVPAAGFAGMFLGGIGGSVAKHNESVMKTAEEFDAAVADGVPLAKRDIREEVHYDDDPWGSRASLRAEEEAKQATEEAQKEAGTQKPVKPNDPSVFNVDEVDAAHTDTDETWNPDLGASVGARQMNPQGSIVTIKDQRKLDIIANAQKRAASTGAVDQMFSKDSPLHGKLDAAGRAAVKFHDAITATFLSSDAYKLVRSGSVVAQMLAYDTMESASGIWRNNRSASMLKDYYEKSLTNAAMPQLQDSWKAYAKSKGLGWYDRNFNNGMKDAFNRELAAELNGRAFDPAGTQRSMSPGIKEAADAFDRWSELEVEIAQGRAGEGTVKGYETIKPYSGYMPQKWVGYRFQNIIRSGRTADEITAAISEGYRKMHPTMRKQDSDVWAAAVVRRASAQDRGASTNLIGILQQDGREYLAEMLRNNGHAAADIDPLIDRLTGLVAEAGQSGHTKGRIDLDMRFTASNGISMMDLIDTDFERIVARRSRGTSGAAALARKGILSKADQNDIIDAILAEQQARGPSKKDGQTVGEKLNDAIDEDKHLTRETLEDLFSYFGSGPVAGGNSALWGNVKKLTNLALLNQLGITQMAETGAAIAANGWERFLHHAGEDFKQMLGNPKSHVAQELEHISVMVPEERLFRDDMNLEMDRQGTAQSELAQRAQMLLDKAQRLQGYTSGFYAVRGFQQRVAVTSATDKIMQNMKGLKNDLSDVRAADIGLDQQTFNRIKKYVDNGTVEFKDGHVHKLNFKDWDADVVEDFALSLNRHVNQVVQKAMIGESNVLFHKDGVASLFFHLKSFTLLAMEKQALRNLRVADSETIATFFAGLATAGAAYTARQAVNLNGDKLDAMSIAKGAIGYSNMTGWLPMWTDPIAGMLQMDSLRFNSYNRGIDSGTFSVPAAWPTLNRMSTVLGAAKDTLTGNMTNDDVRAFQSIPIVGGMYGVAGILNSLKD